MDDIKDIKKPEQMEEFCNAHQDEIVTSIIEQYRKEIMADKKPSENPTVYIVGGQNASGKSKLITVLGEENKNMIPIIIDDMKSLHPYRSFIDSNFPNKSEHLLHIACFEVFNRLFEELLIAGYDVVIERTLGSLEKTKGFIAKPSKYGYNIQLYVTATHEINSLLSSLERFITECELRDEFIAKKSPLKCEPRPISIGHHNDTYKNICGVLSDVERIKITDKSGNSVHPSIFVYDRTPEIPTLLFQTGDNNYSCVKQAMYAGRNNDLKKRLLSDNSPYGYFPRVTAISTTLKNADKKSTLYHYIDYCEGLLDVILERAKNESELFLDNKRKLDNDCLSL